jgi:hypothetical protein
MVILLSGRENSGSFGNSETGLLLAIYLKEKKIIHFFLDYTRCG